ncbi:aromatic prenyltransferase [Streptomyces broussonetiae]|uniref:Aromatic prenyltransferase n=1 Tax=Streptomyces broussonetiae TaxID=2686304 RepID=A0ABV5EDM4_9ACTN
MPVAETEDVYAAIEETAALLNVECAREKVRPVLEAFEPFEGGVIFSATAGERGGDLDLTIQVPQAIPDPYAHALERGLLPRTGHPVGSLLSDLDGRGIVEEYLIDFGVVGGLNKVYVHFPRTMQGVAALSSVPSMPPALAANAGFFARHDLDGVAMIAIDYRHETVNLYFPTPGGIEPKTVLSMLEDMGLPEPEEELLESVRKSFRVYFTLGWDTSRIERISFARPLDMPLIKARVEPEFVRFLTCSPYTYDGERFSISIVKWAPDGQWFNAGSYYQFGPLQREVFKKLRGGS